MDQFHRLYPHQHTKFLWKHAVQAPSTGCPLLSLWSLLYCPTLRMQLCIVSFKVWVGMDPSHTLLLGSLLGLKLESGTWKKDCIIDSSKLPFVLGLLLAGFMEWVPCSISMNLSSKSLECRKMTAWKSLNLLWLTIEVLSRKRHNVIVAPLKAWSLVIVISVPIIFMLSWN